MTNRLLSLLAAMSLLLLAPSAAFAAAPAKPAGDWVGLLKTPRGSLHIILTLKGMPGKDLTAELESPDQAPGQKIPISAVEIKDDTLSFTSRAIGASYKGTWQGDHWQGTFHQGIDLPLDLSRSKGGLGLPTVKRLDGTWKTVMQRDVQKFVTFVTIHTDGAGTHAVMNVDGILQTFPVTGLSHTGDKVHFAVPVLQSTFDGTMAADGKAFSGTWNHVGRAPLNATFHATTEKPSKPKRPQEPKPPFPYKAEDVKVPNPAAKGVTLAGTLTLPEGKGPFPAVILLTGSGPQDRNEDVFGHKIFLVIADYLTRHGIAVLRYDDRGVARSTGDFATANSVDFASDANAVFAYLETRPEINPKAIGFLTHSAGGMDAPVAARTNKDIAFMVLLAAPGEPARAMLASQRRIIEREMGLSEEKIDAIEANYKEPLDIAAHAATRKEAEEKLDAYLTDERVLALGVPPSRKQSAIAEVSSNWFRFLLNYDPADYVPSLKMPLLILNGSLDTQVPAKENLDGFRALLKGHADVTIKEMPGLNHPFQHAKTGSIKEYAQIEETFSPEVLTLIADWINKRF